MKNRCFELNPYGTLENSKLREFEKGIGFSLPKDYLDYLRVCNGGKLSKTIFDNPSFSFGSLSVAQMYGLHDGPIYARLKSNYSLAETYDLSTFRRVLRHLICFAHSGTGDAFLLDIRDGSVCVYLAGRDHRISRNGVLAAIEKVSASFSEFLELLVDEEEFSRRNATDLEALDFHQRLEELKKERKLEADQSNSN